MFLCGNVKAHDEWQVNLGLHRIRGIGAICGSAYGICNFIVSALTKTGRRFSFVFTCLYGGKTMRQSGLKRSLLSIVPGGYETVDAQTGHRPFKRLLGGATKVGDSSETNQQPEDLGIRRVTRPLT